MWTCNSSLLSTEEANGKKIRSDVDGSQFSVSDWTEFQQSRMWQAVLFEIQERDLYIMNFLRYGDPDKKWTDDEMRARINELEFITSLPDCMVADIKIQMSQKELPKEEEEDNFNKEEGDY